MCEGRDVTRPHPTEIPYLLAFFPSLRAASDRTLSIYFPIRPDAYDARFYEGELKRIVEKHWHKLSDVPENCSPEGMEQVAKVLTTWLMRAKAPE